MFGGIWAAGKALMLSILVFFQNITGSYGLAIILLTITIRLLLYPLSKKQMVSMAQMQKIQPRLKVLQDKYANDKEKLNQEMMKLYKDNNVNPLAGCFPLIPQMFVMILLFQVLMANQVANSTFLWVPLENNLLTGMAKALSVMPKDASPVGFFTILNGIAANPAGLANVQFYMATLILILTICFLTWFQQKMSGAANNPQMATMNTIMPFFMGFICLSLPGGVLLYWGVSTLIGIAQQWLVIGKAKEEAAIKPVLYKNKPVPGQKNQPEEYDDDDDDDDEEYDDDDDYYDDDDDDDDKDDGGKR